MRMPNRKALLISIFAGILAAILNFLYISSEKSKVNLGPLIRLLAAKSDIQANSTIEVGMLDSKEMPQKFAPPGYVPETDIQAIVGQNTKSQILSGQPILWSHFKADKIPNQIKLNEGDRAFSIVATDVTGVGGILNRGSRVDIIGTFQKENGKHVSKTLLQNVTVLSTNSESEENLSPISQVGSGSYSHITVIVSQEEAELLAFASNQGELWFTMRDPNDLYIDRDLREITYDSLFESERNITQKRLIKPVREERKEPLIIIGGMKQNRDDNSDW